MHASVIVVSAPILLFRSGVVKRQELVRVQAFHPKATVEFSLGALHGPQCRVGDVELIADIRRLVDQRPSYGYRRIAALLKRERRSARQEPVNAQRVYPLMKKHGLLLQRHTGRRRPRKHDGKVITLRSTIR